MPIIESGSPDPSRTHLERKVMETNCLKSSFGSVMRTCRGQLQLFLGSSEAHIQSLELLAKSVKPFFFFFLVVVVVLAVFFSKELFVQILCLLNQVPKLTSEEGRMGLAFALCETFCAFKKWFCSLWHIYWSTWSLHLTERQVPGDRNLSSIKKVEDL